MAPIQKHSATSSSIHQYHRFSRRTPFLRHTGFDLFHWLAEEQIGEKI